MKSERTRRQVIWSQKIIFQILPRMPLIAILFPLRQDKMVISSGQAFWYLPGEPEPIVARAPPSPSSMLKVPRSSNQLPSEVIAFAAVFLLLTNIEIGGQGV